VLDISEHRVGDTQYFDNLMNEIENGGREAFAHHLLNMDINGFVPLRDTPKNNDAKREMIRRSINPYDARKWIEECCLNQQIIGAPDTQDWTPGQSRLHPYRKWIPGETVPFHLLANAYTAWQRAFLHFFIRPRQKCPFPHARAYACQDRNIIIIIIIRERDRAYTLGVRRVSKGCQGHQDFLIF
jgi:hypothetical protein